MIIRNLFDHVIYFLKNKNFTQLRKDNLLDDCSDHCDIIRNQM